MTIENEQHFPALALHEVLQEQHKRLRVQLAIIGGRPKFAACIDGADYIDALPLAGGLDHRSLSLQSVGPPQRTVRLESGFIQKKNLGIELLGPFLEHRIDLIHPALDCLW